MTRWKPKITKAKVIKFFEKHPEMRSTDMATKLGCSPEYIRATLARAGYRLHASTREEATLCGINQKKPQKKTR